MIDRVESATAPDSAWQKATSAFEDVLRRHFEALGRAQDDAASASTVRTNTELVPKRAGNLLALSRELLGIDSLAGLRVLELGCGFGALATYLALRERPAELVALDTREDYVALAAEASEAVGAPVPRFRVGDMRTLDELPTASFDLAIYNNSFIYLPRRADMRQALRSLARVLRPGGAALFYQANRLALREPFTHDPILHLLPPRVARTVCGVTGWRHNHGRVRLVSPDGLRLMLLRTGFRHVRQAGWYEGKLVSGARGRLTPFYGLGATLPGHGANRPAP
jgi:SAM-dependent methyltransferase